MLRNYTLVGLSLFAFGCTVKNTATNPEDRGAARAANTPTISARAGSPRQIRERSTMTSHEQWISLTASVTPFRVQSPSFKVHSRLRAPR